MTKKELFLANANGEHTERTPIWIMRQAGRYLPGYRAVRERLSFEELCRSPRTVAEVTAEPIALFDLDAAIIFSDILLILEPLGVNLRYEPGPVITPVLENPKQIESYVSYNPAEELRFVGDAIVETKKRLGPDLPLLGFCGAPFTVFSYLCNTRERRDLHRTYRFITNHSDESRRVLELLTDLSIRYLQMQLDAGVDAVQVFDTWAGELTGDEFAEWSFPYLDRIFTELKKQHAVTSLYIRGTCHLLDAINRLDVNIVSLDWKTSLQSATSTLKPKTIQGNLNPYLMLGPQEAIIRTAREILTVMKDYHGYIFNLGHGILPMTPIDNVRALVETVHAFGRTR
ncbi:MAG: uroporphyrinogen decarboxylase [candidate division Zixibacteria bacterium]|nr:uroporphyrinogen decarboxylase [candidate division Zixibacteria bacterium]